MWVLPGRESRDGGLGRGRGAHVRGAGYLDRLLAENYTEILFKIKCDTCQHESMVGNEILCNHNNHCLIIVILLLCKGF